MPRAKKYHLLWGHGVTLFVYYRYILDSCMYYMQLDLYCIFFQQHPSILRLGMVQPDPHKSMTNIGWGGGSSYDLPMCKMLQSSD